MSSAVTILGIDLGKNWFHVIGMDRVGRPVIRKKLNRTQLREFAATTTRCVVEMESCPGSQFWGRRFATFGHDERLIPAQFVKPYVKSNKNYFNDALAIAEATGRATIPSVPLKNIEQLELEATPSSQAAPGYRQDSCHQPNACTAARAGYRRGCGAHAFRTATPGASKPSRRHPKSTHTTGSRALASTLAFT
jgi:hypothetical protein